MIACVSVPLQLTTPAMQPQAAGPECGQLAPLPPRFTGELRYGRAVAGAAGTESGAVELGVPGTARLLVDAREQSKAGEPHGGEDAATAGQ